LKETNIDIFLLLKLKQISFTNYNIVKSILDEVLSQLTSFLAINSHSLGFPEFAFTTVNRLKKFSKNLINKNFKTEVKNFIEKISKQVERVTEYRAQANFVINNTDSVKLHEDELRKENVLLEEYEKIKLREKEAIESRISQVKGEFIKI